MTQDILYELVYDVSESSLLVEDLGKSFIAYNKILKKQILQSIETEYDLNLTSLCLELKIKKVTFNSPFKLTSQPVVANCIAVSALAVAMATPFIEHYLNNATPLKGESESSLQEQRNLIHPLINAPRSSNLKFSVIDKSNNTVINNYNITQPQAQQMDANLLNAKKLLEKENTLLHEKASLEIDMLANRDAKTGESTPNKGFIYSIDKKAKTLIFMQKEDSDYIRSVKPKNTVFIVDVSIVERGDKPAQYRIHKIHQDLTQFTD
jgi:hypothetical protein